MAKKFEIRNSTAEFLTFVAEGKEQGIQVLYKDETVWATQKAMAVLFDVDRSVITKHLKNIFETKELQQDSVCAKIAHTAEDGKNTIRSFIISMLSFLLAIALILYVPHNFVNGVHTSSANFHCVDIS